jgi:hypothetical protein
VKTLVHEWPKYVEGDLFAEIKKAPPGHKILIPHVVNNIGKWGAGFSGPLGEAFPQAKQSYLAFFDGGRPRCDFGLGDSQVVYAEEDVCVANMVAQDGVGTDSRKIRYDLLVRCMNEVTRNLLQSVDFRDSDWAIHAPKFGCGLAGGNWDFIEELIRDCWIRRGIEVTVYWLPEKGRGRRGA